jgi:hypothetical protein
MLALVATPAAILGVALAGWSNRQLARFWPWNSRFESLPRSFGARSACLGALPRGVWAEPDDARAARASEAGCRAGRRRAAVSCRCGSYLRSAGAEQWPWWEVRPETRFRRGDGPAAAPTDPAPTTTHPLMHRFSGPISALSPRRSGRVCPNPPLWRSSAPSPTRRARDRTNDASRRQPPPPQRRFPSRSPTRATTQRQPIPVRTAPGKTMRRACDELGIRPR